LKISRASRLDRFPTYLFDDLERQKQKLRAQGVDIIDLGEGEPDVEPPAEAVEELARQAGMSGSHKYPSYKGLPAFRQAIVDWYAKRSGVTIDPEREVLALIGSKSGMGNLPLATVDPGEVVLVPNPRYPAYVPSVLLAGGECYELPLREERNYLPDLEVIPESVARRAKLMILNYPNNPTTGVATLDFFQHVVEFARRYSIIVAHDAPYLEITFDGQRQPSFLEAPGSKEVGVEFNSFSKMFNMAGWRIGVVVGNEDVIAALGTLKSNTDMGIFLPLQRAAIKALNEKSDFPATMAARYQSRRNIMVQGLEQLGWRAPCPSATFFLWLPVPEKSSSVEFAARLLQKTGVCITPGAGFGSYGEGYIRIALTASEERLDEALKRLRREGFAY
jgi:LL-diaminopimelate aminotransferase